MVQYIDKSALETKIENIMDYVDEHWDTDYAIGAQRFADKLQDSIDTLEVKELPIWEKISPDTGQTTLYKDGGKSYLERFGYRIDLKDLDKLPKKKS